MSLSARTLEQFHVELASKSPTPGGGAVAAITGATAAALALMVVNYSFTRKLEPHHEGLREASARLERARALLMTLADEDAAAYESLSVAMKLPKDDPARPGRLADAAKAATQVPLAIVAGATDLLRLLDTLPDRTNRNLRSDLAIAAMLAGVATRAGAQNVSVNLPFLSEGAEAIRAETQTMLRDASALRERIETACG